MAKTIGFDRAGPIPIVEIHVGQAQNASYSFGLWTATTTKPIKEGVYKKGTHFRIVSTRKEFAKLADDDEIDGTIMVKAYASGQQRFYVKVTVTQGEDVLDTWVSEGNFELKKLVQKWWTLKFPA